MKTTDLSAFPTALVGRDAELADIAQMLANPACRLLTLVGPGGIGKTRLAQEAARVQKPNYSGGVYFVPLQSLNSPDLIYPTIADLFRFSYMSVDDPAQNLLNYLREKHMLLVLDNFEHLIDGAEKLTQLLETAQGVKLLVTSRERLNLREEWVFDVCGLKFPDNGHVTALADYSATRMFVQSAQRAGYTPQPADSLPIARICKLVEGIPLAIELAAAWVRVLPCAEIADEIARNDDILTTQTRNVPEKHRSMRAAFDYSWRLLSHDEQLVFAKLAVFRGGFTREAAEQVAGASLTTLASLVDKSLVRMDAGGRYSLQELLRKSAEECLEAVGGLDAARDAHSAWYAARLERLSADLNGPEQIAALDEIETDLANVRAAWRWAVEQGRAHAIAQAQHTLGRYYLIRSRYHEALEMFVLAVDRFSKDDSELAGQLLLWYGAFVETADVFDLMKRGTSILRRQGKSITTTIPLRRLLAPGFGDDFGGYEGLQQLYHEQMIAAHDRGDDWAAAWLLCCLGHLAASAAKNAEAQPLLHESLAAFRLLGDRWGSSFALGGLAAQARYLNRPQEALACYREHLTLSRELGDIGGMAVALTEIGAVLESLGEQGMLEQHLVDALKLSLEIRIEWVSWVVLSWAAEYLTASGQAPQAVELFACLHKYFGHWPHKRERIEHFLDTLWADLSPEDFSDAVRKGEATTPEAAAKALLKWLSAPVEPVTSAQPQPVMDALTVRELDVLRLMADGLSNPEIAEKLILATGTVKAHSSSIFSKLGTANRVQAINRAKEIGLI